MEPRLIFAPEIEAQKRQARNVSDRSKKFAETRKGKFYDKHTEFEMNMKHVAHFSVKALRLESINRRSATAWNAAREFQAKADVSSKTGW